ncbi:MAG: nickel pincer cofactor biosynthesis protein LarB [Pseudomonadota bacterium]
MTFTLDEEREARTGLPEAILCEGKRVQDIEAILGASAGRRRFFTRLSEHQYGSLGDAHRKALDYDPLSRTAIFGEVPQTVGADVAIVTAGTADLPVAAEAARTLRFAGKGSTMIADVGVAGLWRLLDRLEEVRAHEVVIAVAGMEGALFSVLGGLIAAPIIAVPSPNGYGVAQDGRGALSSALASCAPGVATMNIGNGYGAAAAALRILHAIDSRSGKPLGHSPT